MTLQLSLKKCKHYDICGIKFERRGWEDHRKICDGCRKRVGAKCSKFRADLIFGRWIPVHLRPFIVNIEEEL